MDTSPHHSSHSGDLQVAASGSQKGRTISSIKVHEMPRTRSPRDGKESTTGHVEDLYTGCITGTLRTITCAGGLWFHPSPRDRLLRSRPAAVIDL